MHRALKRIWRVVVFRLSSPDQTRAFDRLLHSQTGGGGPLINGDVHFHSVDGTAKSALPDLSWELRRIKRGAGGPR